MKRPPVTLFMRHANDLLDEVFIKIGKVEDGYEVLSRSKQTLKNLRRRAELFAAYDEMDIKDYLVQQSYTFSGMQKRVSKIPMFLSYSHSVMHSSLQLAAQVTKKLEKRTFHWIQVQFFQMIQNLGFHMPTTYHRSGSTPSTSRQC